ncbi:hypothetical protein Vafri_14165 [Volvox africanus]|uniref:S-adenosyl-L-methionine-dependent methyltransferase n=2 Tax=Volvox africanus TaxID=51714 RepID=A0A8J4F6K0_9CHLO|nr:hypothetical protein Vafri_14165 [Volvox africanus]
MLLARRIVFATLRPNRSQSLVISLQHKLLTPRMTTVVDSVSSPPSGGASKAPEPPEPEVYSDRWEMIWGAGLARGERWDAAAASPAIVDLLRSGKIDVKGARVLVPGCGRGYDLPVFASSGAREVVGLELAPTAVGEARAYLQEVNAAEGAPAGDMRVEEGDFFLWTDPRGGDGSWDVGFDYTFGCAMQPNARQQWAHHWGRHVRSGGVLVTLVFPVNSEADPNVGPPFPVSPELYSEMLIPQCFEMTYKEPVPRELSHPSRAGREVMMVWRKK